MQQYLFKYAFLVVLQKDEYVISFLYLFVKTQKYVNVFVLTNTFKYAFVCRQRIYTEICLYLVLSFLLLS